MRIHELLEACIEYIAYEGILGCEPSRLQRHIQSLDSSVDDDLFNYIFSLLVRHPSIQVAIAHYPLQQVTGTTNLGSAPLPPDYAEFEAAQKRDQDTQKTASTKKGKKGDNVDGQSGGPEGKKFTPSEPMLRILLEDDGSDQAPIKKTDYQGLINKWGSRLRIRTTVEEMYFHLTGSHENINAIGPGVLHTLMLVAQSRAEGITSMRLAQMEGVHSKDIHYHCKVLLNLHLCYKIPYSHQAATSLILFHRFAEQNEVYMEWTRQNQPQPIASVSNAMAAPAEEVAPVEKEEDEDEEEDDGDGDDDDDINDKPFATHVDDLGFSFPPLSLTELMVGHVIKERFLQILDHPNLKNHSLRAKGLLHMIGWEGKFRIAQRRMLMKHVEALVKDGYIERVPFVSAKLKVYRLKKYNPEFKGELPRIESVATSEGEQNVKHIKNAYIIVNDIALSEVQPLQTKLTQTMEHQIVKIIAGFGENGGILAQVMSQLSCNYLRIVDHIVKTSEKAWLPPHLSHLAIVAQVENATRERRLRVFTVSNYRRHLVVLGQSPENSTFLFEHSAARHFADVSYRETWPTIKELQAKYDEYAAGMVPIGTGVNKTCPESNIPRRRGDDREFSPVQPKERKPRDFKDSNEEKPTKKELIKFQKYEKLEQVRGRPRKFVQVIDREGTHRRHVLPNVKPSRNIPPILILVIVDEERFLIPSPPNYKGQGAPEISDEAIAEAVAAGKTQAYYRELALVDETVDPTESAEEVIDDSGRPTTENTAASPTSGPSKGKRGGESKSKEERPSKRVRKSDNIDVSTTENIQVIDITGLSTMVETNDQPAVSKEVKIGENGGADEENNDEEVVAIDEPKVKAIPSRRQRKRGAQTPIPDEEKPETRRMRRAKGALEIEPSSLETATADAIPKSESEVGSAVPMLIDPALLNEPAPNNTVVKKEAASHEAEAVVQTAGNQQATPVGEDDVGVALQKLEDDDDDKIVELNEIRPLQPSVITPVGPFKGRTSLTVIRRRNELIQCLTDMGGVMERNKFRGEHKLWIDRVGGTKYPNAPPSKAGMDRSVFEKTMIELVNEGKVKKTTASMPTTTGRWVRGDFFYLADLPDITVKTYIRSASTLLHNNATNKIPTFANREDTLQHGKNETEQDVQNKVVSASQQRQRLLQESNMIPFNYGWRSGRYMRAGLLFKALVRAINTDKSSPSILSHSPRIIAAPFLFESLTVSEYLACVALLQYDEGFWRWLQQPGNANTRLADVPPEYVSLLAFSDSSKVTRLRSLLSTLCSLRAVSTANVVQEKADFECTTTTKEQVNIVIGADFHSSPYFIIHDAVPVYHIASDGLGLSGLMSATNEDEADALFQMIRTGCWDKNLPLIPRMKDPPKFPLIAELKGLLELTPDLIRGFRQEAPWKHQLRPVPEQRQRLDDTIDLITGERKIIDRESVEQLAYNIALPSDFVEAWLSARSQSIKDAIERRKESPLRSIDYNINHNQNVPFTSRQTFTVKSKRQVEAQERVEEQIKLLVATRERFQAQVREIATRIGTEYTTDLLNWIVRTRKAGENLNDEEVEKKIRTYRRGVGSYSTRAPRQAPALRYKKDRGTSSDPTGPIKRYRQNWTKEDYENLIDGEAIIRARAKEKVADSLAKNWGSGHDIYGHAALNQIFPGPKPSSLYLTIKKYNSRPGNQAYFDRLVSEWYDVWVKYRGTDDLPDDDYLDVINFDIKRHIAFLRQKIDKTKLRLNASFETKPTKLAPDLLPTVEEMVKSHRWVYKEEPSTVKIEKMWDLAGEAEDSKLNDLAMGSIVDDALHLNPIEAQPLDGVLRAIIMILVGSEDETWDRAYASTMLEGYDRNQVDHQIARLIRQGILLSRRKNTAAKHERAYQFSKNFQQASNGHLPPNIWPQAEELCKDFTVGKTIELPIIGKAGHLAALMDMVSKDEVSFDFKPVSFPLNTKKDPYNTRSMNDEAFEFEIRATRCSASPLPKLAISTLASPPELRLWENGRQSQLDAVLKRLLKLIKATGESGLTKPEMQTQLSLSSNALAKLLSHLAAIGGSKSSVFWTGYDTARLVDKLFLYKWIMQVKSRSQSSENDGKRSSKEYRMPRRWIDIWGDIRQDELEKLVWTVCGYVLSASGQSEYKLRRVLDPILDRLEQNDILQYLLDSGKARRTLMIDNDHRPIDDGDGDEAKVLPPLQATDVSEEDGIAWWAVKGAIW